MAPKRKSDAMDSSDQTTAPVVDVNTAGDSSVKVLAPSVKKARVANTTVASDSTSKARSQSWKDVKISGEDEDGVPVYDDCAEVRRKIKLLQKTPNWKVTHWLKEIGGINSNSFNRFMKEKGRTDGASNGTYYAAYVYFEKVRILEGKKKTATRISNESTHPNGFPLENRRHVWAFTGR
ncbi:hypothetical protein GALMADRAFT_233782 [Galerina marginata CBS 339.88]|uniref:DUF7726 domain-containing protein n=1 Tax=Galerina marginata (strain CBS 339.88) TaxID=685588 RepID=A0A067U1B5_GALM3|nr:hypothetical protein GALMADRAFT_233782 [Galerina marginata CBS 339.88]